MSIRRPLIARPQQPMIKLRPFIEHGSSSSGHSLTTVVSVDSDSDSGLLGRSQAQAADAPLALATSSLMCTMVLPVAVTGNPLRDELDNPFCGSSASAETLEPSTHAPESEVFDDTFSQIAEAVSRQLQQSSRKSECLFRARRTSVSKRATSQFTDPFSDIFRTSVTQPAAVTVAFSCRGIR